ncbi:hypothetical protein [Ramlibacter albus]|uniref:Uncharacterized protein n=1 Tax=Ramlibacter albus TaxID=2079448 RepID=A0A923M2S7_9BURK|nr:hypothetical protein [Ramlibacter albus]MBC5763092.1 hypothetical protein [Ramlibacter albus]
MAKTCIRCGYERRATDTTPDYACPSCGVVYAKAEAAHAEQEAHRARIAAMAAIAAAKSAGPGTPAETSASQAGSEIPGNARAEALIRQMAAQRAETSRAPAAYRGMALVALVAFSVGFASAAGMYSAAGKLRKPAASAAAPQAADCAK